MEKKLLKEIQRRPTDKHPVLPCHRSNATDRIPWITGVQGSWTKPELKGSLNIKQVQKSQGSMAKNNFSS